MLRMQCGMIRRGEIERGIALDAAREAIAMRIRRVCEHFGEAEFNKLVARMAEIEVRYRLRDDWSYYGAAIRRISLN